MLDKMTLSQLLVIVLLSIVLSFILSYPLMILWNLCLVPAVSVLSQVTWIQMWGISILIALLVKPLGATKQ